MNIPDGQKIKIKNKTLASCGELLFKAYMIGIEASQGIHRMIYDSIMSCDKDIQCALFKNIWLSGGTTMINQRNQHKHSGVVIVLIKIPHV